MSPDSPNLSIYPAGWCHWHRAWLVAQWTEGTNSHHLPSRFIGLPCSYFTQGHGEDRGGGEREVERGRWRVKREVESGEGKRGRWRVEREVERGSDRVFTDKSPCMTIHSLKKTLLAISSPSIIRYHIVCVCVCVCVCVFVYTILHQWGNTCFSTSVYFSLTH